MNKVECMWLDALPRLWFGLIEHATFLFVWLLDDKVNVFDLLLYNVMFILMIRNLWRHAKWLSDNFQS